MNKADWIYLISFNKAVRYTGSRHHMSLKAAIRRFDPEAIAVSYSGSGAYAADLLKLVSAGQTHLSIHQRNLIAEADAC